MGISAVSASAAHVLPQAKLAPDGDSPAVEAAESAATKQAEKQGGGFAAKAVAAAQPTTPGGVNKLV